MKDKKRGWNLLGEKARLWKTHLENEAMLGLCTKFQEEMVINKVIEYNELLEFHETLG